MDNTTPIKSLVENVYKQNTRKTYLDKTPHFVPLSLKALEITLGKVIIQDVNQIASAEDQQLALDAGIDFADKVINLNDLRNRIQKYVEDKHSNKIHINGALVLVNGEAGVPVDILINEKLPAIVYSNGVLIGTLYSGYDSAYNGLFKSFLNKEIAKFLDDTIYEGTNYKKGFDVGHILGNSALARTPLGVKIQRLLDALSSISDVDIGIPGYVAKHKEDISTLKSKVEAAFKDLHTKSNYGKSIEIELEKDFGASSFLLSIQANIVVIQDRFENQNTYGTLIEGLIAGNITTLMSEANFSRNLKEEMAFRVIETIKGTKSFKQEKITKKLPKTVLATNAKNIPITQGSGVSVKGKASSSIAGQDTPNTVNLTSLQGLINQHLQSVISANMGDGSSSNILNYRTGRFAASVKVERMSQSREGMITAFYSYMKNPYQTFEPGFLQGSPKTRDPKLLISKSIREIAEIKVANRMRAVSV
jgi:hypothetical protein